MTAILLYVSCLIKNIIQNAFDKASESVVVVRPDLPPPPVYTPIEYELVYRDEHGHWHYK